MEIAADAAIVAKILVVAKKKVKIDHVQARKQFLSLRPQRNPILQWEENQGRVILTIPKPNNIKVKLINLFFPVPESRQVILDPIGTHVWRLCDGKNSVSDISRSLQNEYKLGAKEAELSLRQFFQDIGKRGYIGFAIEKSPQS